MGAPRRIRKKYSKPKDIWNAQRIESDNSLINKYGLKNMHELWKIQTEVSRIRGNARRLLASSGVEVVSQKQTAEIIERLMKAGVINQGATLDTLLDIKQEDLLERRLESFVFRKGMSLSMKQARQLIVHGFIAVDGKKVTKPSFIIRKDDENKITYYKQIEILKPTAKSIEVASADVAPVEQTENS